MRVALNGRLALEAIAASQPALVLSDIVMPEMDGYQLCREVKARPEWRAIPVVLITSLFDPEDIVRGLECGADNFIRKPYATAYLMSRIEQVLANRRLRQQADAGDPRQGDRAVPERARTPDQFGAPANPRPAGGDL